MTNKTEHAHDIIPRFNVLGIRLSGITLEDSVKTILRFATDGGKHRYVCIFAVESVLKSYDIPKLATIANHADLTLCDGMPLVFIGRKFGKINMNRCYGPDVMIKTIADGCATGIKHFFYGGVSEEAVEKLEDKLREKFPDIKIAGHYVPPFRDLTDDEKSDVIKKINASGADIVWVGIGTPRQDYWVGEYSQRVNAPVLIAVGAAFNFHAGTVPQAPRWMMRNGLEWLFRLYAEPRRLWRRYLIGNPRFLLLLMKQLLTGKPEKLGAWQSPEK